MKKKDVAGKNKDLTKLEREIKALEEKKTRCVTIIRQKSEDEIREQREISELRDIRNRISNLSNEISNENGKWEVRSSFGISDFLERKKLHFE